jgi:nicotinamidase-related amidase
MTKNALIVIDMLNDFFNEKGVLFCGESARLIIPVVQERIRVFRDKKDPIIFLRDSHDEEDLEFEKFPKHAVSGTWGSGIIPEIEIQPQDVVLDKKRYSGFYGTDLEAVLNAADPDGVEVVGVCTSICVMDTVGGLVNRDYQVTVPEDGVADFDPEAHDFAIKRMKEIYGVHIK